MKNLEFLISWKALPLYPNHNGDVLVIDGNNSICLANWSSEQNTWNEVGSNSQIYGVKYWAYLPEIPS